MEQARVRIRHTREQYRQMMAATVVEVMEEYQDESFTVGQFEEELIARWRKQEDEILVALIADLAEEYRRSRSR